MTWGKKELMVISCHHYWYRDENEEENGPEKEWEARQFFSRDSAVTHDSWWVYLLILFHSLSDEGRNVLRSDKVMQQSFLPGLISVDERIAWLHDSIGSLHEESEKLQIQFLLIILSHLLLKLFSWCDIFTEDILELLWFCLQVLKISLSHDVSCWWWVWVDSSQLIKQMWC